MDCPDPSRTDCTTALYVPALRDTNPPGHCQRAEVRLMAHPQTCHGQAESGTKCADACGAAKGQRATHGEAN